MFKVSQLQEFIIDIEVIADKLQTSIEELLISQHTEKKAMYDEMQLYTVYYLTILRKIELMESQENEKEEGKKILADSENDIKSFIQIANGFLNYKEDVIN
jgi:hypothetical protein